MRKNIKKNLTIVLYITISMLIILAGIFAYFKISYEVDKEKSMFITNSEAVELFGYKDKETTQLDISSFIDNIKKIQVNKLYVEVVNDSVSLFESEYYTTRDFVTTNLTNGFDFLQMFIKSCKDNKIEVYALLKPLNLGSGANFNLSILDSNSDYFVYEENYYLTPSSMTSQNLINSIVSEIITRYSFDGVLFDDFAYISNLIKSDNYLEEFEKKSYDKYQLVYNTTPDIRQWRIDSLSTILRTTYRITNNKKIKLSVCVNNNSTYNDSNFVDTQKWLNQVGYADTVVIKLVDNYENINYFKSEIQKLFTGRISYKTDIEICLSLQNNINTIDLQKKYCERYFYNYGYTSYSYTQPSYYSEELYDMEIVNKNLSKI